MSITFVYRDENNKVQVKKIEYEEVKKDLMKYLSHDIRSIIKEKEEDFNYWFDCGWLPCKKCNELNSNCEC